MQNKAIIATGTIAIVLGIAVAICGFIDKEPFANIVLQVVGTICIIDQIYRLNTIKKERRLKKGEICKYAIAVLVLLSILTYIISTIIQTNA